jgi:hypothetical protein
MLLVIVVTFVTVATVVAVVASLVAHLPCDLSPTELDLDQRKTVPSSF